MEGFEKIEDEDGAFLVRLARKTIQTWLQKREKTTPPKNTPEQFLKEAGVFVTLNKADDHQLRGCIGFPLPIKPLVEATIEAAIESATADPRFPPVTNSELDHIIIEVSILTPPTIIEVSEPKNYPSSIEIGKDGLIIENGHAKGLLLPQVAVEWKMDEEEFLCNCCMKAGLPPDSWLTKEVKISKFQALIFSEIEPNGKIIPKALE